MSILQHAFALATQARTDDLLSLFARYPAETHPHRLQILDQIPETVPPEDFLDLLPGCHEDSGQSEPSTEASSSSEADHPALTADQISAWYKDRVDRIDRLSGSVSSALSLVQHGASKGVPGLESLGEELTLLAKLVYDAPLPPSTSLSPADNDWTLSRWRAASETEIIGAYLAYSTPDSIVSDVKNLVLPFLSVLESKREREGRSDMLVDRLLYDYILQISAHRLDLVASLVEASKPTLSASRRIVKSDQDLARLALACLYGNTSLDSWEDMGHIFESLPAFRDTSSEGQQDHAIARFVTRGSTPDANAIFAGLASFSEQALSRALDTLDVHLEAGEIFARWDVPVPLHWFLLSADDRESQRSWATKMARREVGHGSVFESDDEWLALMDAMVRLSGERDDGVQGAFGLLTRDETLRIFFGGLLSSGRELSSLMLGKKRPLTQLSHRLQLGQEPFQPVGRRAPARSGDYTEPRARSVPRILR
jgi:hypothetical protein